MLLCTSSLIVSLRLFNSLNDNNNNINNQLFYNFRKMFKFGRVVLSTLIFFQFKVICFFIKMIFWTHWAITIKIKNV